MPRIEGRELERPIISEMFIGEKLVLRIDDKRNPEFWLTLAFTPEELNSIFHRYSQWLHQCENQAALLALTKERF